jgi:hypothetical protein
MRKSKALKDNGGIQILNVPSSQVCYCYYCCCHCCKILSMLLLLLSILKKRMCCVSAHCFTLTAGAHGGSLSRPHQRHTGPSLCTASHSTVTAAHSSPFRFCNASETSRAPSSNHTYADHQNLPHSTACLSPLSLCGCCGLNAHHLYVSSVWILPGALPRCHGETVYASHRYRLSHLP